MLSRVLLYKLYDPNPSIRLCLGSESPLGGSETEENVSWAYGLGHKERNLIEGYLPHLPRPVIDPPSLHSLKKNLKDETVASDFFLRRIITSAECWTKYNLHHLRVNDEFRIRTTINS